MLLISPLIIAAQSDSPSHHVYEFDTNIVFVDGSNVRTKPSLNSEILTSLPAGTSLDFLMTSRVRDTIGGRAGMWKNIQFNESQGYIWEHTIADMAISSKNYENHLLAFKQDKNKLKFKAFENGFTISENQFVLEDGWQLSGLYSYGSTVNSLGDEVVAVVFYHAATNAYPYILLSWNGSNMAKAKILLRDDSLLTGTYLKHELGSYIIGERVNVRSKPSLEGNILATLPKFSKVETTGESISSKNYNSGCTRWEQINFKGQHAYVCSDFVNSPGLMIKSNYGSDPEMRFASGLRGVFVLTGNEVLDYASGGFYADGLINFGRKDSLKIMNLSPLVMLPAHAVRQVEIFITSGTGLNCNILLRTLAWVMVVFLKEQVSRFP